MMCSGYFSFMSSCFSSAMIYLGRLENGAKPQQARGSLINDLHTEIVVTANIREWLHIFSLRDDKNAHPDMHILMSGLHQHFIKSYPLFFGTEYTGINNFEVYEKQGTFFVSSYDEKIDGVTSVDIHAMDL